MYLDVILYRMHGIELIEPEWWMNILNRGISLQDTYPWIAGIAPRFADIFVFLYPIFLVILYVYAIIKQRKTIKQGCLYIFLATFIAVLVNIGIQCFFYKERPINTLTQVDAWETLLHGILPTSSFPSDHAVVSMAFAMATLLWWLYNKRKFFIWSWIFFIIVSLIMTACRILTLVHWPSDILAGLWLWVLVPLLLMIRPIRYALIRHIINPIIRFEQWLIDIVFNYKQPEI